LGNQNPFEGQKVACGCNAGSLPYIQFHNMARKPACKKKISLKYLDLKVSYKYADISHNAASVEERQTKFSIDKITYFVLLQTYISLKTV
jgi:hypothetical protein